MTPNTPSPAKRPHIVIFNPDSYRGDVLGHLGNPAAVTPNVDAILNQGGVSYANAFSQNPVCTPSRCSFITGQYPHTQGHRSMKHMLRDHEPHLLKVLMREGYKVWWSGKNDMVAVVEPDDFLKHCTTRNRPGPANGKATTSHIGKDDPRYNLFYRGVVEGEGPDWPFVDQDSCHVRDAAEHIRDMSVDEPTCLLLTLASPHPAYAVEKDFYDLIDPAKLPPRLGIPENDLPALNDLREAYKAGRLSEADWTEIKHVYYAMCTKIDALFGQVVDALKAKGIYDDTLIVFMSDHGDFTGDYSLPEKVHFALQDNLIHVPFVIKPPAHVACKSGVRQSLVELVDLCPTIYDMLNIDPDYPVQGKSLLENLSGDDSAMRECIFAEVGSRAGEVGFSNKDVLKMPPDSFYAVQSSVSHQYQAEGSYVITARSLDYKYIRRGYNDHHELYDLKKDPGELHNLINKPEYAQIQQTLTTHLLNHFMQTADVLRHDVDSRDVR